MKISETNGAKQASFGSEAIIISVPYCMIPKIIHKFNIFSRCLWESFRIMRFVKFQYFSFLLSLYCLPEYKFWNITWWCWHRRHKKCDKFFLPNTVDKLDFILQELAVFQFLCLIQIIKVHEYKRNNWFLVKCNYLPCMTKSRIQRKQFAQYSLSSLLVLVVWKALCFLVNVDLSPYK